MASLPLGSNINFFMLGLNETYFTEVMQRIADGLKADPHHRLLSWDHAWKHWMKYALDPAGDDDLAALHLAFYLASWGMYRGSSDLLYRDYKALIPAVQFLKSTSHLAWQDFIFNSKGSTEEVSEALSALALGLQQRLEPKLVRPGKVKISVSDTLLSKILLNTLGCVPAFDSEVKSALIHILGPKYPMGDGFDAKRLTAAIELARHNEKLLRAGKGFLEKELSEIYPLTKVFDFYLWHHGFDLPKKTKLKK